MGKIIGLSIISLLLIAFDLYIYKAILNIYPQWSAVKKRNFKVIWWAYTILLLLGVFVSLTFNLWL